MKNLLLILFTAFTFIADAQSGAAKLNPKAVDAHEKAYIKLRDGDFKAALPLLQKAIEIEPKFTDAILSLASAYGEMKNYPAAVEQFEKAMSMDEQYFKYFFLPYSINLAGTGQFNKAFDAINKFLAIPELNERSKKSGEYRKRSYEFAIEYAKKDPTVNYAFAPKNLGDSVNSKYAEYFPAMTINDSMFVFTRRTEGREDFLQSFIKPGKTFGKAKQIDGDINIEPFKGGLSVSQDGEWLIFAGNFRGGVGDYDIYISYNTPGGWSEPENLGSAVNSEYWESSPTLSPDKKALYFSSKRPGGFGGSDIYVSYRTTNGRWSKAINMGPNINTAGNEEAPFLHADNATLYFTSNGLQGYGDVDLFLTRKGPNNEWSIAQNLGYPINTIDNDGTIFIASDAKTAYYASEKSDSRGGLDIYTFELRPTIRPAKTLYVQGRVFDKKTNKGLPSAVELIDNLTQKSITKVQTDETGNYFMTLPVGKDYTFSVNRKGYLFFSELYPLSKSAPDSTYYKDIPLQPVEVNASLVLKNILFETNSAQLQNISNVELNTLLQLMAENPTIKVQINGYTDNVGKPTDNLKLSTARAQAVVDYLVSKGIKAERLMSKGFGETKPIADNTTEAGRSRNRRTEFVIISQ
jgi:outer membrane protein OmpA-like peptidoglycan-associated protein/tetratricopeptide (TPR) repeat protein